MIIQACLVLHNFAITRRDEYDPLIPGEQTFQQEIDAIRRSQSRHPRFRSRRVTTNSDLPVMDSSDSEDDQDGDETSTMNGKEFRKYIADKFFKLTQD
jgi:hypothetical protein